MHGVVCQTNRIGRESGRVIRNVQRREIRRSDGDANAGNGCDRTRGRTRKVARGDPDARAHGPPHGPRATANCNSTRRFFFKKHAAGVEPGCAAAQTSAHKAPRQSAYRKVLYSHTTAEPPKPNGTGSTLCNRGRSCKKRLFHNMILPTLSMTSNFIHYMYRKCRICVT